MVYTTSPLPSKLGLSTLFFNELIMEKHYEGSSACYKMYSLPSRDFLNPILLVTLFLPGSQVSAAAALGCLYYFALANQVCPFQAQAEMRPTMSAHTSSENDYLIRLTRPGQAQMYLK